MELPYMRDNTHLPPEVVSCQIKGPVPDVEFCSWNCQIKVSQHPPQSIQSIAIALDCSTELDGIAELLKRPHSNYRTCGNQGGAATLKAIHQRGN